MVNTALPFSILLLCLFQLYFQYSTLMTPRNKLYNEKDNRDSIISFMMWNKKFDFNFEKIEESFEDNPLMKINILKNYALKGFDQINEKRENQIDKKKLKLFYLMVYDIFFIIFIYTFIFGGFKAGILKIIIQIFKFYSTAKRLKKSNPDICICEAILNFFRNLGLRDWGLFTPEGFQILEFLCNIVIILDILWIILIKNDNNNKRKEEFNESSEKVILTDDDRVDYQNDYIDNDNNRIISENSENKIFSNEKNDDNNSDENIENNKDDNNEDNIEENKDDHYNNKIQEDNNNINSSENNYINNSENIENNNIESDNIFKQNNNADDEVNNSLNEKDDDDKIIFEKNEGNGEEKEAEKGISEEENNEQETK